MLMTPMMGLSKRALPSSTGAGVGIQVEEVAAHDVPRLGRDDIGIRHEILFELEALPLSKATMSVSLWV
ncbi:MAG: hypothetical protein KC731_21505 [Myxococcales bacterium]|nr:hypothetical protein [Myxococcales bacterium]